MTKCIFSNKNTLFPRLWRNFGGLVAELEGLVADLVAELGGLVAELVAELGGILGLNFRIGS